MFVRHSCSEPRRRLLSTKVRRAASCRVQQQPKQLAKPTADHFHCPQPLTTQSHRRQEEGKEAQNQRQETASGRLQAVLMIRVFSTGVFVLLQDQLAQTRDTFLVCFSFRLCCRFITDLRCTCFGMRE